MAYHLEANGVVRTQLTGVIRGDDLVQHALELGAAGHLARPLLLDARGARLELSESEIGWLADVVGGMRHVHGHAPVAMLTDDEASTEVARRYAMLMRAHNPHFATFRVPRDAEVWVRSRSPGQPHPAERPVEGTAPVPPKLIGWARVHPTHLRRRLGLDANRWYPVIERPPGIPSAPLPGYVWLDDHGRYRQVWPGFLETIPTEGEQG